MTNQSFHVRAPGRICLFGEHSDYLGLDVIAASIDLAIEIVASPRDDNEIHIDFVDLREQDVFSLGSEIEYRNRRDYIRSSFNVMRRKGFEPEQGWNLQISGNIPIAAGLSSSSALTVGAIMAITRMSGKKLSKRNKALAAYDAEVVEFGESGGTMDHYASAVGGVIHVNMASGKVTKLPPELDYIVIGDSGEKKKDTVGDLRYIRTTVEKEYEAIKRRMNTFDRRTTPVNMVTELTHKKSNKERTMAEATLRNRDLTNRALKLLSEKNTDPYVLGKMLQQHHEILRDDLKRSTPKIEKMIHAARGAGAIGCKINGSGGGGSMMALSSGWEREVASAIARAGGTAYIVKVGKRASLTTIKK
ncbi:MAG: galactokinase family protein [Candidatus Thorarchaeota archaeon]